MSTITHYDPDCQPIGPLEGEEIPFETGPIFRLVTITPWENPIGQMLADYRQGIIDTSAVDASLMTYEEWIETVGFWTFEPEPAYFENEVMT